MEIVKLLLCLGMKLSEEIPKLGKVAWKQESGYSRRSSAETAVGEKLSPLIMGS